MHDLNRPTPSQGPLALVDPLLGTLQEELDALETLGAAFDAQLAAVRERHLEALEAATERAQTATDVLDRLGRTRERQTRLLARVLRVPAGDPSLTPVIEALAAHPGGAAVGSRLAEARARLRSRAEAAEQVRDELAFALEYALGLGRDLVEQLRGLGRPAGNDYTAGGGTARTATQRSLLNHLG